MNFTTSTFTDVGHSSQPAEPDTGVGLTRSILVFHLGDRAYGLAVEHVIQIIAMIKLTPVPQPEQMIEGVANIRGKIIPVISARRHLGLPLVDAQLYTPIILLQSGNRTIGMIVDEVADVIRLPAGQMTIPDAILPQELEGSNVLEGVVYHGDKVIMVIDPRCLLNPTQMRIFRKAANILLEVEPENIPIEPLPVESSPSQGDHVQPETDAAPAAVLLAPTHTEEKKQPAGKGHGKSRKGRRNFDITLASEVAGLAADLPPSDGQQRTGDAPDPGFLPTADNDVTA